MEETANKSYLRNGVRYSGDKATTAELGKGLIRIEVTPEAAPYSWQDYKKKSGAHRKHIRGLEKAALECGAKPSEWRVSFSPVPKSKWLAVEVWNWPKQIWEDFATVIDKRV